MNDLDLNKLDFVGKGSHGKVYRLDQNRCVKVYKKEKHMNMEYWVLKHCEGFSQFPKVYKCEGRYMIREFFDGLTMEDYIKQNGLSKGLSTKLLEVIDIFKQLQFTRLDCKLTHIIVTDSENLKVIDPTRNMDKVGDYPRRMLEDLTVLGFKEIFLNHVKEIRPDYYTLWKGK